MHAQVYRVLSKVKQLVTTDHLWEVSRDDEKVRTPFDPTTFNNDKRYFLQDGSFLHRVFILERADSEDELRELIAKGESGPRRTLRVPRRKSLGDLTLSVANFEVSTPAPNKDKAVKAVKAVRSENLLHSIKNTKRVNSKKITPSVEKELTTKRKVEVSNSKSQQQKKMRTNAAQKKDVDDATCEGNDNGEEDRLELQHTVDPDMNEVGTKETSSRKDELFEVFSESASSTSTPIKKNPNEGAQMKKMDFCVNCQLLQKRVEDLETQIMQQQKQHDLLTNMNNNLQNLCTALTQQASNKIQEDKKNTCKIKLTSNVTEENGVDVPPSKIYIGKGFFVEKADLVKVEGKKPKNFKTRMARVVGLVLPKESDFNLAGVQEFQLNAIHKLLNLLSWKNISLKPLKVNKKFLEPLTYEHVKRKLGVFLSEEKIKKETADKEKAKKGTAEDDDKNGSDKSGEDKNGEEDSGDDVLPVKIRKRKDCFEEDEDEDEDDKLEDFLDEDETPDDKVEEVSLDISL